MGREPKEPKERPTAPIGAIVASGKEAAFKDAYQNGS